MKELLGLVVGSSIGVFAVHRHLARNLPQASLITLLAFGVLSGLAIANYDLIAKLRLGPAEIETFRAEVQGVKAEALDDVRKEVAAQAESVRLLISTANNLADQLRQQQDSARSLITQLEGLDRRVQEHERTLDSAQKQLTQIHAQTEQLFQSSKEIALALTRVTFLQIATRNQFGNPPSLMQALGKIENNLNGLVQRILPDPQEKQRFVAEVNQDIANSRIQP